MKKTESKRHSGKVHGNHQLSLYDILQNYIGKKWQLPIWQREFAWDEKKVQGWQERIESGGEIPGVIQTFFVGNDLNTIYINDGANRVRATKRVVDEWCKNGVTEIEIQIRLHKSKIAVQCLQYDNFEEAMNDFCDVNQGTTLTAYELANGILTLRMADEWDHEWKPAIQKLHSVVSDAMRDLRVKRVKTNKHTQHKERRDDYGLFLRYIERDKETNNYYTSREHLDAQERRSDNLIENRLVNHLQSVGIKQFNEELDSFSRFFNDQVAIYNKIWQEAGMPQAEAPAPTHARFFLCVAIYRQNKGIAEGVFENYIKITIEKTKGSGQWKDERGVGRGVAMALGDLTKLSGICKQLKIEGMVEPNRRRRIRSKTQVPGHDRSHLSSWTKTGKDETFLEPSLRNKSRGTLPVNWENVFDEASKKK